MISLIVKAWVSKFIHTKVWDGIIHPRLVSSDTKDARVMLGNCILEETTGFDHFFIYFEENYENFKPRFQICFFTGCKFMLQPRTAWCLKHFPDDILKCIFLNEKVWISIDISLKFVPKGIIDNIQASVQIMAWCRPGDKPLSELMMVVRHLAFPAHAQPAILRIW